jgi:hypothetical protein
VFHLIGKQISGPGDSLAPQSVQQLVLLVLKIALQPASQTGDNWADGIVPPDGTRIPSVRWTFWLGFRWFGCRTGCFGSGHGYRSASGSRFGLCGLGSFRRLGWLRRLGSSWFGPSCPLIGRVGYHRDPIDLASIRLLSGTELGKEGIDLGTCRAVFGWISTFLDHVGFDGCWLGLGRVRLGWLGLGRVRLGHVRLGHVRLSHVRMSHVRMSHVRLGRLRIIGAVRHH